MLIIDPNIAFVGLSCLLIFLFWLFVFIIFYHLVRFGVGTQPKIGAAIFVFGSIVLFFMSVLFFSLIDWDYIVSKINKPSNASSFYNLPLN